MTFDAVAQYMRKDQPGSHLEAAMKETRYGMSVEMPVDVEEATSRVTNALKEQGFGVLTTIDVRQTWHHSRRWESSAIIRHCRQ